MKHETNEVAETLASIQDVIEPIVSEIEDTTETERLRQECDALDYLLVGSVYLSTCHYII